MQTSTKKLRSEKLRAEFSCPKIILVDVTDIFNSLLLGGGEGGVLPGGWGRGGEGPAGCLRGIGGGGWGGAKYFFRGRNSHQVIYAEEDLRGVLIYVYGIFRLLNDPFWRARRHPYMTLLYLVNISFLIAEDFWLSLDLPSDRAAFSVTYWNGGKDPHPQDFSLAKKTTRFTLRGNFVLAKDRKRPYYGHFVVK